MKNTYVAIIDQIGRNIIGTLVKETETSITLHNPVILFTQPTQNKQLQVQSYPVFFFEFLKKEHREQNNWTYSKSSIVTSDVILDDSIILQYQKINTPPSVEELAPTNNPKVVSINDL
jgi:hypothetical protein